METTYDDPSEFMKPFTSQVIRYLLPKEEEVPEYVCAENNRDFPHLLESSQEEKR